MTIRDTYLAAPSSAHWTDEYAAIVEHFFWVPQGINRRAGNSPMPWPEVWAALRKRETPLNHLMNIFFRLAPEALSAEILRLGLPNFALEQPSMLNLRGHPVTGMCQPDFAFACGGALVFLEMKVSAKLSTEQVAKYALAAAVIHPEGPTGLICLGPAAKLTGADDYQAKLAAGEDLINPKLQRWREKLGVSEHAMRHAMGKLNIGKMSYASFYGALTADLLRTPSADETRRKLVLGMAATLKDLGLTE